MYNKLATTITKESDPVRQTHYTTKRTWLVDFIDIFLLILKLFPHLRQILCFYWCFPYWLWNPLIQSVSCTGIFCPALRKNRWTLFIMSVPMPKWIIPGLWMWPPLWLSDWFLNIFSLSLSSSALMIPWSQNSAKNLRMFQSFLTMRHTMVPIIWMDTVLSALCFAFRSGKMDGSSIFLSLSDTVCGRKKNPNWNLQFPWYAR